MSYEGGEGNSVGKEGVACSIGIDRGSQELGVGRSLSTITSSRSLLATSLSHSRKVLSPGIYDVLWLEGDNGTVGMSYEGGKGNSVGKEGVACSVGIDRGSQELGIGRSLSTITSSRSLLATIENMGEGEGQRSCKSLGMGEVGVDYSSSFCESGEMLLGGSGIGGVEGGNGSIGVSHKLGRTC